MLELNSTYLKVGWMLHKVHFPHSTLTVIAKGTYELRNGARAFPSKEQEEISGDLHALDDPARAMRYSSDFVPYKPNTDVLLAGHCYAPGGRSVDRLPVSLSVGDRTKRLVVIGNCYWISDFLPTTTKPEPFTTQELSYENSYGGPGFDRNPIGKGHAEIELPNGSRALPRPNIVYPEYESRSADAQREPAGFGPFPSMWHQRRSKTGTYHGAWLRQRWPWFPSDFDWSFFNAAPPDQQFNRYLAGDEKLRFENLHPDIPNYECSLPAVRVRCFYADVIGAPISFSEVLIALDTVWIDMDAEKVILVWRGVTDLRADQIGKRDWLVVAAEEPSEDPKPLEFYESLARRQAEAVEEPELSLTDEIPDAATALLWPQVQCNAPSAEVCLDQYARGQSFRGQDLTGADLSNLSLTGADFRNAILTDVLFRHARLAGADFEGAVLAGVDLTLADLEGAVLSGADLTGARLSGARLSSARLERADLSRAILREVTLEGAHAESAIFRNADLFRAVFRRACLKQADLSGAALHEADFSEAVLTNASMEEAVGFPICAERADLTGLRAAGAVLWSSNFRNAIGAGSLWQRAQLRKAVFVGSDLSGAEFDGAGLSGADLSGSILRGARLVGANLRGSSFRHADLFNASVEQADLTQASFAGANLYGLKSFECVIDRTDFDGANIKHTLFEVMS